MNYVEVRLRPLPMNEAASDILAAMLAPLGYDSFTTESDCLLAYCPLNRYEEKALTEVIAAFPLPDVEISWVAKEVETQNWNASWEEEQQMEPIIIGNRCIIHSPSMTIDAGRYEYEVQILPRMSFGSGHHETTSQLLEEILDVFGSRRIGQVLDMGTGTGVLGILCGLCGADGVRAIEIDDWVAANAVDNVLLNDLAGRVGVECGDASLLNDGHRYDMVIANINRNVLLEDMPAYVGDLNPGGILLMSGFFEEDISAIQTRAEALGMRFVSVRSKHNWAVVRFEKPQP